MEQYSVTGMSCAACSARVEKAVLSVSGVNECSVNLLTNSMSVSGSASPSEIIKAVKAAGYGAKLKNEKNETQKDGTDDDISAMKKRLVSSVIFLAVLMYFSMGHMMFGFPLPAWFNGNHVAVGIIQLLLTSAVMVINQKFFISGFKGLVNRAPNMDTLVSLGASASFCFSVYALMSMTKAQSDGNVAMVMKFTDELYFESAAMILTLITVGKTLEARSKGKTTDAIKSLIELTPKTAVVLKNGEEITVSVSEIQKGDIFIVKPGGSVPADGRVVDGNSAVDESALTGESIPVDKSAGDTVSAATINQSGYIKCEATRVGEDTTLSQIIKLISDAAASKAPIAKIADKISGIFVPAVLIIATVTFVVWEILGQSFGYCLARAISVLVISCPCALGLATPVAIMVGSGVGAKNGILFKTAAILESAGKVDIVAVDKTGTVTSGKPQVTDIFAAEGTKEELLSFAASLERKSEHPLSEAVTQKCEELGIETFDVSDFQALPGHGLKAKCGDDVLTGGNLKLISSEINVSENIKNKAEIYANEGKTPLFFAKNDKILGIIAVADTIKKDSPQAVEELRGMGIKVIMLTGDNKKTAEAMGRISGVDEVIAEVLPGGKEQVIQNLKKQGRVAMVGDGINDAPALTSADVGIAIGAGADIAIDAADIVLVNSRLSDVPAAIKLSRNVLRNIYENLFWAFIYNVIGIPLAAGCFTTFGLTLNPMFGAAAMSLSSFCVVSNALRLNWFKK